MNTFLDKIIADKRKRIESAKAVRSLNEMRSAAEQVDSAAHRLRDAISGPEPSIIAEFKRASPSKGLINDSLGSVETALMYKLGGAAAISVLTEEDHFLGSLDDLIATRNAVDLPLLRKDFIVDEYQIYESAVSRANAVLLIVAALTSESLHSFQTLAHSVGLDVIVEVHDREEMQNAIEIGAAIIGVNNRNLRTFQVSLETSRDLIRHTPEDTLVISESGITSRNEIDELFALGYSGFLIGEAIMQSRDPASALGQLL